jgi:hypothetical protein
MPRPGDKMRNATLAFLIVALAAVGACNRSADQAPGSRPQAAAPTTPPAVNQPSSGATRPQAPSASAGTSSATRPSKELTKEEESSGQPQPGTGGADHSTPGREPGARG